MANAPAALPTQPLRQEDEDESSSAAKAVDAISACGPVWTDRDQPAPPKPIEPHRLGREGRLEK